MTTELATVTPMADPLAGPPRLQEPLRRSLADVLRLDGGIEQWSAPTIVPDQGELRTAVQELRRSLAFGTQAHNAHVAWCFMTMMNTLASAKADEWVWAFRTEGWLVACGELPADLWTKGTTEICQTHTFMPQPVVMLNIVGRIWEARKRMLERAMIMMDPNWKPMPSIPVVQRLTEEERLQSFIDIAFKHRDHFMGARLMDGACRAELRLAEIHNRAPADWAVMPSLPMPTPRTIPAMATPPEHKPLAMSPVNRATLNRAIARTLRAQGFKRRANDLENEAQRLYPLDDLGRPQLTIDDIIIPETAENEPPPEEPPVELS